MHNFNFKDLDDLDDVSRELGCETRFIQIVLDHTSNFYHQLRIPKKRSKKIRIVYEANESLKNIHKNILASISEKIIFPEYVQGFVFKRSIVTNASLHLSKKYVLNLDIKDFFESIKIDKIIDVFNRELECSDTTSNIFAKLCTFNGCLVQGANTSPILANLVCKELDQDLFEIAQNHNCSYSRYADDITFSGDTVPRKKIIESCIKSYGFNLNPDKWKLQMRGKKQYVTGLTVFDDNKPRISKYVKQELRQAIYYMQKYGLSSHFEKVDIEGEDILSELFFVDGLIAFMYSVEPEHAYKFDLDWQQILTKECGKPSRNLPKLFKKFLAHKSSNDLTNAEESLEQVNKT